MRISMLLSAALLLLIPATAIADGKRATIVAKALSYEPTLPERAKGQVQVAILYRAGDSKAEARAKEWEGSLRAIADVKIQGMTLSPARYPFGSDTAAELKKRGAHVIVMCDGLSAQLAQVKALAAALKALSIADVRSDSEKGITLGVFMEGGKPKVVINLQGAKNDGVKFSSKLLQIAEVIR